MKSYGLGLLLLGLGIGIASAARAQTPLPPASADTTAGAPADTTAPPIPVPPPAPASAPPPAATTPAPAAAAPAATTPPPANTAPQAASGPSKMYYGATVGFSIWGDVHRISIQPMVGYKVTPRLSVGGEVLYEHLKDTSGPTDHSYDNYGLTAFSRFRLTPRFYAMAEFEEISYDFSDGRELVPFLYLGGGVVQSAGRRVSLYAEVLVDVLQDDQSPYNSWEPQVSVGAAVGF